MPPKEGQVWPLQLIFVVLLILGSLGLVAPTALGNNAWLLLLLALLPAAVLYFPTFRAWMETGSAVKALNDAVRGLAVGRLNGRLEAIQERAEAIGRADLPESVVGRLHSQAGAIGDPDKPADAPTSVVGRLQTLQTQAIGDPSAWDKRTVLQRLDGIEATLSELEKKVGDGTKSLSDQIDKLPKP
jgi:hypothetical protein